MIHYMKLNREPFLKIRSKKKIYELRLFDEKRQKLAVGDIIEFSCIDDRKQKLRVQIKALHQFPNFAALYGSLPLEKCGYKPSEVKNAKPEDMEKYYSKEKQAQYGVLAIEMELLDWQPSGLIAASRYISMLLRHKPHVAGLTLDRNGWADVSQLLHAVGKSHGLTMEMLEEIVDTDNKQRFSFNEDKTLIRANQGHSVAVDVELEELPPPDFLWHGTGEKYEESIDCTGLLAKNRLYVHLSMDMETAVNVGSRHGKPVVYRVNTKQMAEDGYRFYKSVNNVWLTKYVPAYYLEKQISY